MASALESILWYAWRGTYPLRAPARSYTRLLGLTQDWRMFANPPLANTYLVARFHLSNASGSDLSVDDELLLPAERDHIRGSRAFALSYRDKALANALSAYEQREREHPGELAWPTAFGTDPLAPVSRWATTRFDAHLPPGRQIRCTELWRIDFPIRERGDAVASGAQWTLVDSRTWRQRGH